MFLRSIFLAALAAALVARAAHPQPGALRADTADGVAFRVPAEFSPLATPGDAGIHLFHDPAGRSWAFVAPLREQRDRNAVIRRIAVIVARAAFGAESETAEWAGLPSDPTSAQEAYRKRLALHARGKTLDLTFREYRAGNRQVVAGSAFVSAAEKEAAPACGELHNVTAALAEAQIAASLRNDPPVALAGAGGPPLVGGPPVQGGAPPDASDPDVAAVSAAFHAYIKALIDHDGARVAALAAPAVVAYFAELRTLALYAPAGEVRALPLDDRLHVLILRHMLDAGKLRNMSALDVLAMSVSTFEFETDGSSGGSVPVVEGDVASVALTWNGKPSGQRLYFVRRDGGWRVDFLSMMAGGACALRGEMRSAGVGPGDENGVLLLGFQRLNGRPASPTIWEPLIPAGDAP